MYGRGGAFVHLAPLKSTTSAGDGSKRAYGIEAEHSHETTPQSVRLCVYKEAMRVAFPDGGNYSCNWRVWELRNVPQLYVASPDAAQLPLRPDLYLFLAGLGVSWGEPQSLSKTQRVAVFEKPPPVQVKTTRGRIA